MSGADLDLDLEALGVLASDLKSIRGEFENANSNADAVAGATGENHLKDRVETFARNWDLRRKDMIANLETLQANIDGIVTEFTAVDLDLKAGLEQEDAGTPNGAI